MEVVMIVQNSPPLTRSRKNVYSPIVRVTKSLQVMESVRTVHLVKLQLINLSVNCLTVVIVIESLYQEDARHARTIWYQPKIRRVVEHVVSSSL